MTCHLSHFGDSGEYISYFHHALLVQLVQQVQKDQMTTGDKEDRMTCDREKSVKDIAPQHVVGSES